MSKEFTEKIKKKLNKLTGYAIWLLILILAVSVVRGIGNAGRIKAEIDAEEARVAKMREDNRRLEAQILQTQGEVFIEKEIRDKLGLVKGGEAVVVLPDEDTLRKLAPVVLSESVALPDPNWRKWLKLFI